MEKKTSKETKIVTTISKKSDKPKNEYNIIVAQDGSGDYKTVQEAINNSPAFPNKEVTIRIKNGIYKEKLKILECNPNLHLIGESRDKTILTYDDYFSKIGLARNSTFYTPTLMIGADNCSLRNLTIENSSGEVGQAVALSIISDKVSVTNCKILGNQDTLYLSGENKKQYFNDCYIEGTTDFIFGSGTAVFEKCTIHSKKNSYITAASTPENCEFGFVFFDCNLTAEASVDAMYLGRPWRIYAKTVFLNCTMGNHIKPEGWENWKKPEAEKTSFYAEYNCKGAGFQPEKRVSWSHQLSKKEAKKYTLENIFELKNTLNKTWFLK